MVLCHKGRINIFWFFLFREFISASYCHDFACFTGSIALIYFIIFSIFCFYHLLSSFFFLSHPIFFLLPFIYGNSLYWISVFCVINLFCLFDNKFSICIYWTIFLNKFDSVHEMSIGMRCGLIWLIIFCARVDIFGEVLVVRIRGMFMKLLMHVYTIEIHIFDSLFFRSCKFSFAFALETIVIVILIWRICVFVSGCFFIVNSMKDGIITYCLAIWLLVGIELRSIMLFES